VNSEELELSLRSEFEAHLKKVFADVQQQVANFQGTIDAELDKHRSQMLEALNLFTSNISAEPQVDKVLSQSVIEHLRIARDEGAKLAAKAMADAETMDSSSPNSVSFNFARDAVNDISSQTSQAAILQALVRHCEHFAPRGIFFIIRNEHFVGWQVLGNESHTNDADVRELNFPISSDSVISDSVRTLTTAERKGGSGADNSLYLQPLGFKAPSNMQAIPLVARGRGVAALYVDGGTSDRPVNIEALEMLVRVAGLTVELLASNQAVRPQQVAEQAAVPPSVPVHEHFEESFDQAPESQSEHPAAEFQEAHEQHSEPEQIEEQLVEEPQLESHRQSPEVQSFEVESFERPSEISEPQSINAEIVETFEPAPEQTVQEPSSDTSEPAANFSSNNFDFTPDYEAEVQHFEGADVVESPKPDSNGTAHVDVDSAPDNSRVTSTLRRVDLPIEVSEEERGTHTKARRFARLLVSEIKLYNEDKVKQGREANDLYNRLKEAIDRSREMYDKRVEPPVSSKFDYFHYELVNDLAEGDPNRLGSGYPGSVV